MYSEGVGVTGGDEPPVFLAAAGHPVRWRLLGALAGSDRQVHELTAAVGERQSLVSYHLGVLRSAELVRTRRSAADGRDVYYRLDLVRCGQLLAVAGGSLHPALRYRAPGAAAVAGPARVLFLCTGNSSRSQMAEALLRSRSGGVVVACSAGSRPKPVHPDAVAVMAARGVDLRAARSKHLDVFSGERFDRVITLCDRVREVCPEFPGRPVAAHWSMADPSAEPDGRAAFERTADELTERIEHLLHTLEGS
ncbi:ArsR family transcriptional regulator [Dactylosporangium sp. NPDC051541]|uniref:arsenate reductase/protein-tyrosine-phosphatase family protein n=1 Tax=Dactylosporangium sp. NPDC051541 TaxID=3363977 RepID=UPI00379597B2